MTKKRVTYIVSEIDRSLHFEWITPFLKSNFHVSFILIGKQGSALEQFLESKGVAVFSVSYLQKFDLILVWCRVFAILRNIRPHIVHTHLWIANLVGLTAAWLAGVNNRIYTRHHATIHHKKHRSGLKWDRLSNRLATTVIAISKNVEHILVELDKADEKKVRLIRHGFDFSYFQDVQRDRIEHLYRKYNINTVNGPVIGVISRFTEWKGIQYIIPAFEELRKLFPNAHLILANAHGDYHIAIDHLLSRLPPNSFTTIRFENDLAALYRLFDIFVHAPIDESAEAFGQVYVEPLIVGIPCVFTLSGIARELIIDRHNAMVVAFENASQIAAAMRDILTDEALRTTLVQQGTNSVRDFRMEKYLTELNELYRE